MKNINASSIHPFTPGNSHRIQSLDLARGFTVLMMPMIHVVMLYSKISVQQSWLGDLLGFIAEGPGAQLFMLLMGVSLVYSKKINRAYVLQRSFTLLLAAYCLNFLKFIIPLLLGGMPENLLAELQLKNDVRAAIFFLLINDILQFAAIAYAIIYVVSRINHFQYWSILFAVAILFLSPYTWDIKTGITGIDLILALFNAHPPQTFFPVFPWLTYPLLGLTLGYYLKKYPATIVFNKAGLTGLIIIIISLGFPGTTHLSTDNSQPDYLPFYRTQPADTLFHAGLVLVWLCMVHWIVKKIRPNKFFDLLIFCSKNITMIYLIQWILICWGMAITGYGQLNFLSTISWMLLITAITLSLTYLVNNKKRQA